MIGGRETAVPSIARQKRRVRKPSEQAGLDGRYARTSFPGIRACDELGLVSYITWCELTMPFCSGRLRTASLLAACWLGAAGVRARPVERPALLRRESPVSSQ